MNCTISKCHIADWCISGMYMHVFGQVLHQMVVLLAMDSWIINKYNTIQLHTGIFPDHPKKLQ